jgi:hypothetical protein
MRVPDRIVEGIAFQVPRPLRCTEEALPRLIRERLAVWEKALPPENPKPLALIRKRARKCRQTIARLSRELEQLVSIPNLFAQSLEQLADLDAALVRMVAKGGLKRAETDESFCAECACSLVRELSSRRLTKSRRLYKIASLVHAHFIGGGRDLKRACDAEVMSWRFDQSGTK